MAKEKVVPSRELLELFEAYREKGLSPEAAAQLTLAQKIGGLEHQAVIANTRLSQLASQVAFIK